MKTTNWAGWLVAIAAAAGLMAQTGCSTTKASGGGTAVVEFVHPEKYTDIGLRDVPPERARQILLPDLERFIQKQARLYVPGGSILTMRITDIDDAGWIRPLGVDPRRVVRPSQPGRIDFEYVLTNQQGQKVSDGKETLSDLPWERTDRSWDSENLPLMKQMLQKWMTHWKRVQS